MKEFARFDPDTNKCLEELSRRLGIDTSLAKACLEQAASNIRLLDRKQKDYGADNLTRHGTYGVLVRADDKLARLGNLLKQNSGRPSVKEEALSDTWGDLSSYGLIGQVMQSKAWPPTPHSSGHDTC